MFFSTPLLSNKLPEYSGGYDVGVIDIEAPCDKRRVSDAVLKSTGEPAFELDTVLFSLYYPAVDGLKSIKPHHLWVSNLAQQAEGYARLARINNSVTNTIFEWVLWTLVGTTMVPANVDVPIHGSRKPYRDQQIQESSDALAKFPVIVFSHGTASSRTSYTQFAGELASRGFIVAAIEHRDGSAPGTEVLRKDGMHRNVFHISESDLEPQPEADDLRITQRAMRQAEVKETVRVLRQINDGYGLEVFKSNSRDEGEDLAEWKGRLNMDRIVVGGHSFGATLAMQTLKDAPSEKLPFVGGIILDPGKSSGSLNDDIDVPIVVIHSQSWSAKYSIFQGRPHFDVVKDIVRKVLHKSSKHKSKGQGAWFITSKGTTHPSVTDAPLIEPTILSWTTGSTIDAREGVLQYVKVADEFMEYLATGNRTGVLAEGVTHTTYDEDIRSEERKNEMSREISKYWQIHVSPKEETEVHDKDVKG